MLKTADRATAWPGVAPRVATRVAIALDASWKPLVRAKATASPMAMMSPNSVGAVNTASGKVNSR